MCKTTSLAIFYSLNLSYFASFFSQSVHLSSPSVSHSTVAAHLLHRFFTPFYSCHPLQQSLVRLALDIFSGFTATSSSTCDLTLLACAAHRFQQTNKNNRETDPTQCFIIIIIISLYIRGVQLRIKEYIILYCTHIPPSSRTLM